MKINIINTTTDSEKTARYIADYLVKEKLSPCVQIVKDIESIYTWHGKLNNSREYLMIIKTIPEHLLECKKIILELHNYDIPEIIITEGKILDDTYKKWFRDTITY